MLRRTGLLLLIAIGIDCLGLPGCGSGTAAPPAVPLTLTAVAPTEGPEGGGTALTLTGTGLQGPATVTIGGRAATDVVVTSAEAVTCTAPPGSPGAAVDVELTTPAGTVTLAGAYTYLRAPTLTSVSPADGSGGGGTTLTLVGSGFDVGIEHVRVGSRTATAVVVASDTMLTCRTPPGAGTVEVEVKTGGGRASLPAAFTYIPMVSVVAVSPDAGFAPGGTWLTVTGAGFSGAGPNTVSLAGMAATNVATVSDTTITATAPACTPGATVGVGVTNANGTDTLASAFECFAYPPNLRATNLRLDTEPAGNIDSTGPIMVCRGKAVYVVWNEGDITHRDIQFQRSLDGGQTWLPNPITLNTNGTGTSNSIGPRIGVDGTNVYVIWRDDRNNTSISSDRYDVFFNRSTNSGATWLASDVRVDTAPNDTTNAVSQDICCDGQTVYACWTESRIASNTRELMFSRSTNGGTSWLASDVRIDRNTVQTIGKASQCRIACSGSNVHVAWQDTRDDTFAIYSDIYTTSSTDGGVTWPSTDKRLDTDTAGSGISFLPQIVCRGSDVHVIWADQRNGNQDVYYSRSTNSGTSWLSTDVRINTDAAGNDFSVNPRLCLEGTNVYAIWMDRRNGTGTNGDVYFSRSTDRGANWLASDVRINTDSAGAAQRRAPWIACGGGNVFAVWEDHRHDNRGDIYYTCSRDAGVTWLSTDVALNDDGTGTSTFHNYPEVCCDGARAYFVWQENRNNAVREDIYFTATRP